MTSKTNANIPRPKAIKIYGERNTNTNYLSELIHLNLSTIEIPGTAPYRILKLQEKPPGDELLRDLYFKITFTNNLGWKHSCFPQRDQIKKSNIARKYDIHFITITKNPYSWLLSLYKRPYHQHYKHPLTFSEFLAREWKLTWRDNAGPSVPNPIILWNKKK